MMAYLIAIEGVDGAGKGTISATMVDHLNAQGKRARLVSFPRYKETVSGYIIGEHLGGRLPFKMSPQAAATIYALDRYEARDTLAALASEHDVLVFDRYLASNIAYQAAQVESGDAPAFMDWIAALEVTHFGLRPPDRCVFLNTPAALARRFISLKHQRSYTERTYDEYEADDGLQDRVRANYLHLAKAEPELWQIVTTADGVSPRTPAAIVAEILAALPRRLQSGQHS